MKRKIISIFLVFAICFSLLPMTVLADVPSEVKYINVTGDGTEEPLVVEFGDMCEYTVGALIEESGELKTDCSEVVTIINNVAVTIADGGAVNTEALYIYGNEGSLTIGDVTLTANHSNGINGYSPLQIYLSVTGGGSESLKVSGQLGTNGEERLSLYQATVASGDVLILGSQAQLVIASGGSLKVDGNVTACQDASIMVCRNATVTGLSLYDETLTNLWTDFSHDETFVWLDGDDTGNPLLMWARFFDGGDPKSGDKEFWFEYDNRDGAVVTRANDNYSYFSRWSQEFQSPEPILDNQGVYEAVSFILTPPDDGNAYDNPIVEVEVFDGHDDVPNHFETLYDISGVYSFLPYGDYAFVIRVWWTEEQYKYDTFFMNYVVEFEYEGNGTVSVTGGDSVSTGNRTKVGWDVAPGDVVFTLDGESLEALWIEQEADGDDSYNALVATNSAYDDGTLDLSSFYDGNGAFVFMRFMFAGGGANPGNLQYDMQYDDDIGSVQGFDVGSVYDFEVDEPLTWTMSYPSGVDALYNVQLIVFDAAGTHYWYTNGDSANNSKELIVDDANKSLSYTPTVETPFRIIIYWTEEDYYNNFSYDSSEEFQLELNTIGGGAVSLSSNGYVSNASFDDKIKYNFPTSELPLTMTFTPNKGETLDILVVDEDIYSASPATGEQDISTLYDSNTGTYSITLSVDDIREQDGMSVPPTYYYDRVYIEAVFSGSSQPDPDTPWYTVSWAGGNVTVTNGEVIAERVYVPAHGSVPATTYTIYPDEVDEASNVFYIWDTIGKRKEKDSDPDSLQIYGLGFSQSDLFINENIEGVQIDYRFTPKYGYQLKNIYLNEQQKESCLNYFETTEDNISTFTFDVLPGRNTHFCVYFEEVPDTISVSGSSEVLGASIADGGNAATSGNLVMTIKDTSVDNSIPNAVCAMDITLDNVVSKGGDNGNWVQNITEFDEPITVAMQMNSNTLEADEDYGVVRIHNGETEELEAEYDAETNKIVFKTNKFSKYILVKKPSNKVTVAFNMNGHGIAPANQNIVMGSKATKPADPSETGYTFGGWYTDTSFTKSFDFNSAINTDTIIYAKWDLKGDSPNGDPTPTVPPTTPTPDVEPTPTPAPELDVGDFVDRCYEVALGREADEAGFEYWKDMLVNGEACGAQAGYGFIFSAEYINKETTNEQFVTDMYSMFFGREADEDGYNYWVGMLNDETADRETVFAGFANSQEFYNLCEKYGVVSGAYLTGVPNDQQGGVNCFVARLYKVCLNRLPDMGGQAGWVTKLMNGEVTGSTCAYGFVFSAEFTNMNLDNANFVKYMYAAFFGREADEEGLNHWVGQLDGGTATREDIFAGFSGSAEFANLCAAYGINA